MNEEEIFHQALARSVPAERAAFVEQACTGNPVLRAGVEALLRANEGASGYMDRAAAAPDATREQPITERPGTTIGPYKLLQQIGEGGMGVVWMAEQTQPVKRKVALKVIKPGMDSRQVIARFEAERQALAMMDHVNIARVFDGGETGVRGQESGVRNQTSDPCLLAPDSSSLTPDPCLLTPGSGRPYFVMELVHGVPITKYCDDNHLTPRERLELFVPVCQAIQHAHQKGIIHRDIKPSNVMVTLYDGKPVPKVIDFGVAKATEQKLTERTLFTQYGTMVGTLEYMSPEQAEMSALGVDTRSDIYSLGVLLYELLTGSTPLSKERVKEAGYGEILRMIKEEEPPKPSTRLSDSSETLATISAQRQTEPAKLTKLVKGELDWIVMKCLEKDRNRRYETASALAADVQRYLNDEPVHACPPSAWYRFRKFARRNKVALTTAALVAVVLVLGTGLSTWQAFRARQAEALAQTRLEAEKEALRDTADAQRQAVTNLYHSHVREARALRLARVNGYRALAWKALEQAARLDTSEKNLEALRREAVACMGDFVGLESAVLTDFPDAIHTLAMHPDEMRLAIGLGDGAIVVQNLNSGTQLVRLRGHRSPVYGIAFGPNRERLVSADRDGQVKVWEPDASGVWGCIRDLTTSPPAPGTFGGMPPLSVALTPDDKHVAVCSRGQSVIPMWDLADGRLAARFRGLRGEQLRRMVLSPDGKLLAAEYKHNQAYGVLVWEVATRQVKHDLLPQSESVYALAFSADSKLLACGSAHGLTLFETRNFQRQVFVPGALGQTITFSPDNQVLAIPGLYLGTIRLWSLVEYRDLAVLAHPGQPNSLVFSKDGKLLVGADNRSVRIWNLAGAREKLPLFRHTGGLPGLAFSPDGKLLATAGKDHTVLIWEPASGTVLQELTDFAGPVQALSFSPDGRLLATGDWSGAVRLWEVASWKERAVLAHQLGRDIWSVAFSPDGNWFAAAGDDGAMLWRLGRGQVLAGPGTRLAPRLQSGPGKVRIAHCICFSADGSLLALEENDKGNPRHGTVHVWDVKNARPHPLPPVRVLGTLLSIAFHPDGKRLVLVSAAGVVEVWDVRDGQRLSSFGRGEPTGGGLASGQGIIALSPDGAWLAAQSGKGVTIWDMENGSLFLALPEVSSEVWCLAWGPNQERLAIGLSDGGVVIWDFHRVRSLLTGIGLGW